MNDEPWEGRYTSVVHEFALQCRKLRDTNPYDLSALEEIAIFLATELWDQGFSQTEIRKAFELASGDLLTSYGAGEDRRDDKLRH